MKDVSEKKPTHRVARAEAFLAMPAEVRQRLVEKTVEKGDALEVARVAAILAAKHTPDILPLCHPLFLSNADARYSMEPDGVRIETIVKTTAPTGVEMEALTAASVAALTLYDMLKPYTTELEIRSVRLLEKTGGKSDFRK